MSDSKAPAAAAAAATTTGDGASKRRTFTVFERYAALTKGHVNPFTNHSSNSTAEKVKLAVASVTIFPIRMVLLVVLLTCLLALANLSACGVATRDLGARPLAAWRRAVRWVALYFVRAILFVCGFYWITENGEPAPAAVAPVAISNHASFFDPMFFVWKFRAGFVAKKEAADTPVLGSLTKCPQCILVDRNNPNSRHDAGADLKARAQSAYGEPDPARPGQRLKGLWHGARVMLFPEGTTTNGRALISFKAGAFSCGVPIQPVVHRYAGSRFDLSWGPGGLSALELFWRMNCQLYNSLEVTYLPVHTPSDAEKADPALFARNVRLAMAAALGVGMTEHSFDDVQLVDRATGQHKLPGARINTELSAVAQVLPGVTAETVRGLLDAFAALDRTKAGVLSRDQFGAAKGANGVDHSGALRDRLFAVADVDGTGQMDFRSYVLAVGALTADTEAAARLAFELFDADGDGVLSRDESAAALRAVEPQLTAAECDAFFADADAAQAGTLAFAVWWAALQRRRPDFLGRFRARVVGGDLHVVAASAAEAKAKAERRAAREAAAKKPAAAGAAAAAGGKATKAH